MKPFKELVNPNKCSVDLQTLDEKVKSMMEKGQRMIPSGKRANGTPLQLASFVCKMCGKEGRSKDMRNHIEANHYVIIVTRPIPRELAWKCTKVDSINKLYAFVKRQ